MVTSWVNISSTTANSANTSTSSSSNDQKKKEKQNSLQLNIGNAPELTLSEMESNSRKKWFSCMRIVSVPWTT
jgi:hypothetical protein